MWRCPVWGVSDVRGAGWLADGRELGLFWDPEIWGRAEKGTEESPCAQFFLSFSCFSPRPESKSQSQSQKRVD